MSKDRKRHHFGKLIVIILALSVVSVIVQVFWPGERFMFATKVGGVDVAGMTQEEAYDAVSEIFTGHILDITSSEGDLIYSAEVPLDQIAIDSMILEELEYPLWQRLVPFSSFARVFYSNWVGAEVNLDIEQIISTIPEDAVDAHISIIDDEVIVLEAKNGAVLDRADLEKRLSTLRLSAGGSTTLRVRAEVTTPSVTDEDIAYLLESDPDKIYPDLIAAFKGSEFSVYATSLSDNSWSISISGDEVWTSASTYKLFVAYSMLQKVDQGDIAYASIKTCLERTIINSDNTCPENWLSKYGFSSFQTATDEIDGIANTRIASNNMETTAHDLSIFLESLYHGKLLSEDSTNHLLEAMKVQTYRDAIPAGVATGETVADKVGFIYGLLHDAAIVYSEAGDYALVIMTDGSTWANMAELTRIIDRFNSK